MGISSLRPFLQSLCCNSPWNYAVFWKFKHQHEMTLAWEDGFYDLLKPKDSALGSIEDSYLENSNKILSSTFISSVHDGTPGEYSLDLAVTEMASASHVVGKGVVGEAAYTGNARWIYSDRIATNLLDSALVPEYPDDLLLQFAAGIKTILLLPVTTLGVLQLGSVEMVAEDESLVAYIKNKFEAHNKSDGNDLRYSTQQFPLMSAFMENFEELSSNTKENVNENHNAIRPVKTKYCDLFANQMMPVFTVQDLCDTSMRGITNTRENVNGSDIGGMIHEAELSCGDNNSVITDNNILKSFHLDEKVKPHCENLDLGMYEDFVNELMDIPTFIGNDFDNNAIFEFGNSFFSFPLDCELHKALGPAVVDNTHQYTYDTSTFQPSYHTDMSGLESSEFPMNEVDMEQLLEAVLANVHSSSDDSSSNKSNVTSCNRSRKKDTISCSFLTSEFIANERTLSSVESKTNVLADKPQKRKKYDSLKPEKLSRLSTTNKKRVCGDDNQRQRPRDRQLIQDRIKELRELVPNSEKSSIDGLLDKTIKHMLFLKNVTNRADKLRSKILEEEADGKITRTSEVNYRDQNGTSWAVELGNEQQLCPIVVKDLNHPGHILIEMLCTDHGRFLEIADVIHRLELTILKGVMEKSSDNSWAHFIVETSGSFHRLDIFWPLMQLLQQSKPSISSKI